MHSPAIFLLLAFFLLFSSPGHGQQRTQWFYDLNQAWQDAQQNQRPVLVYFRNQQARGCQQMEAETLFNPEVVQFLSTSYTACVIDTTQQIAVARRFGVFAVPTVVLLDLEGKEFTRLVTHYPPGNFIAAVRGAEVPAPPSAGPRRTDFGGKELFRESFDSLFGWGNDGSAEGSQLQLALVKGVDGRAFKATYRLRQGEWNYVQFNRELDQRQYFRLPPRYTFVIQVAGMGGFNSVDLKLVDVDGTNHGVSIPIPTDFKGHQIAVTSQHIGYLWGGQDKFLDQVKQIQIAITPDKARWDESDAIPKGAVFLDEFVILEDWRTDVATAWRPATAPQAP